MMAGLWIISFDCFHYGFHSLNDVWKVTLTVGQIIDHYYSSDLFRLTR